MANKYKIEIGAVFKDEKRHLMITDRFIKEKTKKYKNKTYAFNESWYKYTYLNCGWADGEINQNNLLNGAGCTCCHNLVVVPGINDIPTTAPWMIQFFQGGINEAKQYTYGSTKEIYPKCPICGRISTRKIPISYIHRSKKISCICNDGISFPEKIFISILEQLNLKYVYQLGNFKFKWCGKYRYDFYLQDYNCIIETHGMQHYNSNKRKIFNSDKIKQNDKEKQQVALENGITNYYIVDCRYSEIEYIKNSIQSDVLLNKIIDVSKINWEECENFALNSLLQKACELKNNNELYTTLDIANILKLDYVTINRYLKKGNKLGLCKYDPKVEISRRSKKNGFNCAYEINVIDKNTNEILGTYRSAKELQNNSLADLGFESSEEPLRKAAKYNKIYKGYKIKYTKDLTEDS